MTRKGLKGFRILILIIIYLIPTVTLFLFEDIHNMQNSHVFMWIVIYSIFSVLFLPSFLPPRISSQGAGRVIGLTLFLRTSVVYSLFSIGIIFFALYKSLKVAIIFQLILFVYFLINVFLAFFTGTHVDSVQAKEDKSLSLLKELKSMSSVLEIKINSFDESFSEQKKLYSSLSEDLRFLSPVNNAQAITLENQILLALKELDSRIAMSNGTPNKVELSNDISKIKQIILQRKTILN